MKEIKVILSGYQANGLQKKYKSDAGYDICMATGGFIKPFQTLCIGLKMHIQTPKNQACITIPRSSTCKKGLLIYNAIIDSGYTGEIHLVMTNLSKKTLYWNFGDRLASLVFFKVNNKAKIKYVGSLKNTKRGNKGLGSSGK